MFFLSSEVVFNLASSFSLKLFPLGHINDGNKLQSEQGPPLIMVGGRHCTAPLFFFQKRFDLKCPHTIGKVFGLQKISAPVWQCTNYYVCIFYSTI